MTMDKQRERGGRRGGHRRRGQTGTEKGEERGKLEQNRWGQREDKKGVERPSEEDWREETRGGQ